MENEENKQALCEDQAPDEPAVADSPSPAPKAAPAMDISAKPPRAPHSEKPPRRHRHHHEHHHHRHIVKRILMLVILLILVAAGIIIWRAIDMGIIGSSGTSPVFAPYPTMAMPSASVPSPSAAPSAPVIADNAYLIRVSENTISYNGKSTDLSGLKKSLLGDYSDGTVFTLADDHAKKSVYDQIVSLLKELNMPYIEQ